jgi:UDP-GlcNAc:undecaprenyl-phosphate GlcNAc-1-phosphate transferase
MVLGVPILDVAVVIINRIRRHQSPVHYDKTHLHHRFMATGLSVRQICYVFYGLSLLFGLLAVGISGLHPAHLFKFVGIGLVGATMAALIIWVDYRQRQRGVRIKLGGPDPAPKGNNGDGTSEAPVVVTEHGQEHSSAHVDEAQESQARQQTGYPQGVS